MEPTDTVQQPDVALQDVGAVSPIANQAARPDVADIKVYHYQGNYFVPSSKGGWYPTNQKGAEHYIQDTFRITPAKIARHDLSRLDRVMLAIRDLNSVSWVGSCAGKPPQMMYANGKPILILEGPTLIEPKKADFPTIRYILVHLLGEEQLEYFYGWLKVGLEDLQKVYNNGKQPRPGQFVAFVGPRRCGKNLVQERIITPLFGGRVAKPTKFFNEQTNFNSDLTGAEHWMLSDETPQRDAESRKAFGNHIKGVAANAEVRTEAKFGHPVVLRPFRRGTVSLNDEEENIRTLPQMEDSLEDKIFLFKCAQVDLPLPSGEPIESAIAEELSAFVYYLLHEHQIREALNEERYGIRVYHHPTVLKALAATTLEHQFLEEIDRMAPFNYEKDGEFYWKASITQIQDSFVEWATNPYAKKKHLDVLLSHINKCKDWMAKLAKQNPERVTKRRGDSRDVYYIKAPPGWKPGGHEDPEVKMQNDINRAADLAVNEAVSDVVYKAAKEAASKAALPVVKKGEAFEVAQKAARHAVDKKVRDAALEAARKAADKAAADVLNKVAA